MSRPGQPLPPRDVRVLAACSHLGHYFGVFFTAWLEIGSGIFPSDPEEWGTAALALAATAFLLAPPAAALWAARVSPWRGFLFSHGARALVLQSAALLAILAVALGVADIPVPEIVALSVSLIAAILGLAWAILPVGAAFRARDGDLAWYPLVPRLFPDPPAQGWRTPLPPGSP